MDCSGEGLCVGSLGTLVHTTVMEDNTALVRLTHIPDFYRIFSAGRQAGAGDVVSAL